MDSGTRSVVQRKTCAPAATARPRKNHKLANRLLQSPWHFEQQYDWWEHVKVKYEDRPPRRSCLFYLAVRALLRSGAR